eukprot:scaffold874_cov75-Skeletonema_marinoi.AAC.1
MSSSTPVNNNRNAASISSLGEASGIAFLLSNHAIFGMAERYWFLALDVICITFENRVRSGHHIHRVQIVIRRHKLTIFFLQSFLHTFTFHSYHFDLIETLTSLPLGRVQQSLRGSRRERGLSISSQEGGAATNNNSSDSVSQTNKDDDDGKERNIVHHGKSSSKNTAMISSSKGKSTTTTATTASTNNNKNSAAAKSSCICGVVSLLECVAPGGGSQAERATRRALRSKHREFNTRAQAAW